MAKYNQNKDLSKAMPRKVVKLAKPQGRTRVGNAKGLFLEGAVDGRSLVARRFRELFWTMSQEVGGDPTEAQIQLIRRACLLSVHCESVEAEMAVGGGVDIAAYCTAANSLRRIVADLGIERKIETIVSVNDYIKASKKRGSK